MPGVILSLMAHPDDAEFLCAGTLARLNREHGWAVHIATMTAGDCGSAELDSAEIAAIRRLEGAAAAAVIGARYHCLEMLDLRFFYDEISLDRVVRLFREVRPDIVVTHSPSDYMPDHEIACELARAAAFGAPIRNYMSDRGHGAPMESIPHLYYADPVEGKDRFGNPVQPGLLIDVTSTIDVKREMLCAHASQREWLLRHHHVDEYVAAMEEWGRARGRLAGTEFAEGFRQHRGHGYPQSDLLGSTLDRPRGEW